MPITVTCPSCQVRLNVADDRAGKQIDCPRCDANLTVPTTSAAASQAPGRAPPPVPQQQQPMSLPSIDLDEPPMLPPPMPPRRSAPPSPPRPRHEPAHELEHTSATPAQRAKLWMIVAGGAGFMLMLVVVAALVVRGLRKPTEETATPAPAQPLTGEQVYLRLIRSATLIVAGRSQGSGFVVDADKKLVVTNYHVVEKERNVLVIFPLRDERGGVVTHPDDYAKRAKECAVRGEVLASEIALDLALIRVERLPENVSAAPLSTSYGVTGGSVFSVGGSGAENNLLWRFTKGTVRGRSPHKAVCDFGTIDCMIMETDAAVNPGDSGGAVVNDRGEVVAVVSHGSVKLRLVSGNIDVEELRKFLSRHTPRTLPKELIGEKEPESKATSKVSAPRP